MTHHLSRIVLFAALISLVAGCSGTRELVDEGSTFSYEGVILGMPVAPVDGWEAFNQRTTYPESDQALYGDVVMTIELDSTGTPIQIDSLFSADGQLWESAVAAVQATEFVPLDAETDPDGLQFSLSVMYLSASHYGAAMEFMDMREELPILTVDEATTVIGKRYLSDIFGEVVETPPEIIGGLESIQRSVRFPSQEQFGYNRSISVFVAFTVNTDGRAENLRITRSGGQALDNEARAAIRRARFHPATRNGEPVPMEMAIPITWVRR